MFFDLKNAFSDESSIFPNTIPSAEKFEIQAQKLGINTDSLIVVYDNKGVYSSPRVWWLFKLMGFHNVSVLNGGLASWKKHNFPLSNDYLQPLEVGNFKASYQKKYVSDFDTINVASISDNITIIDARSSLRFNGLETEPRKGLRSGVIPNSINIPYTSVLKGKTYIEATEINTLFNLTVKEENHLIFSCGSGVTACILALAAEIIGYERYSVYDGSWTEYGTLMP